MTVLIDADILIWALRKSRDAEVAIAAVPVKDRYISVVTRLELIEGIRDKAELKYLASWLEKSCLNIWPLNAQIGDWLTI